MKPPTPNQLRKKFPALSKVTPKQVERLLRAAMRGKPAAQRKLAALMLDTDPELQPGGKVVKFKPYSE